MSVKLRHNGVYRLANGELITVYESVFNGFFTGELPNGKHVLYDIHGNVVVDPDLQDLNLAKIGKDYYIVE